MSDTAYPPLDDTSHIHISPKAAARRARKAGKESKQAQSAYKPLAPKNENQRDYIESLSEGYSTFAIGPAGTGKTYIAARVAAQLLKARKIEKIVVSRVTVSAPRHRIGFLPGNADAKMKPWIIPVLDGLKAELTGAGLDKLRESGQFEIVPFEYMRGRSFENCAIILDEAQNANHDDLTLLVTRPGEGTMLIICGDPNQIDIEDSALKLFTDIAIEDDIMDVIEFDEEDVVRSPLAKSWVKALAKRKKAGIIDKPAKLDHNS